jgi:glycosyltransferase involved in cell wall biosynthesis
MLEAFKSLGLNVDVIDGYSDERKKIFSYIREKIRKSIQYQFIYSESSTMPTALTDPHHLPTHPLIDFAFFSFCKRHGIPIGLFYRDIYWRFENYRREVNAFKATFAKMFYWFDLWNYKNCLDRLFLPSLEMGAYVPLVDSARHSALPPGHSVYANDSYVDDSDSDRPLKLFYVGGMSSHYQMHKLFEVIGRMNGVQLTVCTRKSEWEAVCAEYPTIESNIHVVHESGQAMEALLKAADVALLFVKPQEYWGFAAPVKLYEYIGFHKPVIASEGTLAGRFVQENEVGWTIPYEKEALANLLVRLQKRPGDLKRAKENAAQLAPVHTWEARARQVIKELSN